MKSLFDISKWQRSIQNPLVWCVILIGLSVPISVVFDNVLLAIILLGALFSFRSISLIAVSHPVARAAMLLFSALFIAMFYGATPINEALKILLKYVDLAFIPIFIFLLSNDMVRRRARFAFLIAMAITLLASYLLGLEILPVMSWMNPWSQPDNPAIFHSHITQNNMMAFAIFIALLECRDALTRAKRLVWCGFALLGIVNVLFMVQGRTGYLILLTLLGWFTWSSLVRNMNQRGKSWGWKQGVIVMTAFILIMLAAYHTSTRLHERVETVMSEYQTWTPNQARNSSTGERLDFYSNTLQIVRNNLLTGVGTGGFPVAFALQTTGVDVIKTHNPHNEYLMISVQTGIVGLALLLFLFYTHWRYAPLLPSSLEQDAARGLLLTYVVNCSLNSALLDHADGLFFAFMTAVLFSNLKVGIKS